MTEAYHRLYRSRANYAWWRPLLAVILAAVLAISASSAIGLIALMTLTAQTGGPVTQAQVEQLLVPDAANPLSIVLSLLSVAVWLPIIFFSLWAVGLKPVGMLHSITLRLRWRRLLSAVLAALVFVGVAQLVSIGLFFGLPNGAVERVSLEPQVIVISVIAVLLLVPFQAAAEEYAFRGILVQALGSWIRNPVLPVIIPTVLFTLAHGYNVWGLAEVLALGLTAGWLTVKTGGLESAIAIHVVNNVLVFLVLIAGLLGTTTISADAGSPLSLAISLAMLAGFAAWVLRRERSTRA